MQSKADAWTIKKRNNPQLIFSLCKVHLSAKKPRISIIKLLANTRCDEGGVLEGSPLLFCDGTRWNGTAPHCKRESLFPLFCLDDILTHPSELCAQFDHCGALVF